MREGLDGVYLRKGSLVALMVVMIPVGAAVAQSPPPAVVRVEVTQAESGALALALAGADIIVLRNGVATLIAKSDVNGRHAFQIDVDTGRYSVAVRKIGYIRTVRLLPIHAGDTLSVSLSLARGPVELEAIRATADQLPSKNYYLDAAEIASTTRGVFDAYDALSKLRPNMLGDDARCGGGMFPEKLTNVWINGRHVMSTLDTLNMAPDARGNPQVQNSAAVRGGGRGRVQQRITSPGRAPKFTSEPDAVDSILVTIKSEHIEEIRYVNCWDMSMGGELGTNNALYIVLKPGYDWDRKHGSYPDSGARKVPR